jgi:hypothetical protein
MVTSIVVAPKKSKYRPASSRKPPAIKTAVISRRSQGITKRQIAREVGISANTVNCILEESHLDAIMADQAQESAKLIPEALRVARVRLSKDSENMAIKVLENTIWPLQDKPNGRRMNTDVVLNQTLQVLLKGNTDAQSTQSIEVTTGKQSASDRPAIDNGTRGTDEEG